MLGWNKQGIGSFSLPLQRRNLVYLNEFIRSQLWEARRHGKNAIAWWSLVYRLQKRFRDKISDRPLHVVKVFVFNAFIIHMTSNIISVSLAADNASFMSVNMWILAKRSAFKSLTSGGSEEPGKGPEQVHSLGHLVRGACCQTRSAGHLAGIFIVSAYAVCDFVINRVLFGVRRCVISRLTPSSWVRTVVLGLDMCRFHTSSSVESESALPRFRCSERRFRQHVIVNRNEDAKVSQWTSSKNSKANFIQAPLGKRSLVTFWKGLPETPKGCPCVFLHEGWCVQD